jgi:hypothetical protein
MHSGELEYHLIFGTYGQAVGWVKRAIDEAPSEGERILVPCGKESDSEIVYSLYAEVLYVSSSSQDPEADSTENASRIVLYGSEEIPSPAIMDYLEAREWTRLDDDEVDDIIDMCSKPTNIRQHNVLILVGKPGTPRFQAWGQSLVIGDSSLPPFGRRMLLDPVSSTPPSAVNIKLDPETGQYDERNIDPRALGSLDQGLPSIVIHSELISQDEGDVIFWVSGLGEITGFDMLAAGWAQINIPEDFDPEEFQAETRIALALEVRLIWVREGILSRNTENQEDELFVIQSYTMDHSTLVSSEFYHLLPPLLAEYCQTQKALLRLGDIR